MVSISDLPPPLPVQSVGWTMSEIDGQMMSLPSVALDTVGRADVADLARVHAIEGIGDIRTLATPAEGGVRFDIVVVSPVRCHLSFVVSNEHRSILEHAAREESLVLATGDPSTVDETWLAVNIDGPALTAVLDQAT